MDNRSFNSRLNIIFAIFIIVVIAYISRLIYIQVYKHDYYLEEGKKQYSSQSADNASDRGRILAQNKVAGPTVIAENVEDKVEVNGKTITKNRRLYVLGEVGAKVLGYFGYTNDSYKGQYGIEKYYNDVLSRDEGDVYANLFAELFANVDGGTFSNVGDHKGDVVLTTDIEASRFLYRTLNEIQNEWHADTVGGIIMDPRDGRIIAMEEIPTFDPNKYNESKISNYKNDMISGVYEMGSIVKPITMAAALDASVVNTGTTYNDLGVRELNGYKVKNYDGVARGVVNIQAILDQSLNVGIVFLVEQLGTERFSKYMHAFGMGDETGIDLPSEQAGLVKNLDSKVLVDSATSGFGQGMAITPLQTIRALAALGNGGMIVNPYIVDSIIYDNGKVKKIIPNDPTRVIQASTSETISRMLVHVVDTALKKGAYKMDHYSIAAKTGTAQMPQPGGGYYDDRYLHSFFGYFPAYEPKYIIFLFHIHPKGAKYASETLTDPFFRIVKFLINYYSIPPDR